MGGGPAPVAPVGPVSATLRPFDPAQGRLRGGRAAGGRTVCVVCSRSDVYSETFVRAHIDRLPHRVEALEFRKPLSAGGRRDLLRSLAGLAIGASWLSASGPLKQPLPNWALRRYLRREGVSAVLAEYGPTGIAVADDCAAAGIPLIVHFHGRDAYGRRWTAPHRHAYRRMFASARAIVAVSRSMLERLAALGAPREKLFLNPCGADTSLFHGADPASAPPHFVAVGRLVPKKAPHLTLFAFGRLVAARPEARLTLFGDGPLLGSCVRIARALGIDRAVRFAGAEPQEAVAAAMRSARALVHHAVRAGDGDAEGTPLAVLEAGAAGLPAIGTRHGGVPDVVIHGETGLLVEPGDVDGMAREMVRLADDPALAAELGRRARRRIEDRFSLDGSVARLGEIIDGAIEAARRARSRPRPSSSTEEPAVAVAPAGRAPRVSVVIPTYNRTEPLRRAVASVLGQTFRDLEVLVVDDGSSDGRALAVLDGLGDPRIRVLRLAENRGASRARNAGILGARGEWVAFLDSDDEWLPEKLERQMARLERGRGRDPGTAVVYCPALSRSSAGAGHVIPAGEPSEGDVLDELLHMNRRPPTASAYVVERSARLSVGGFDESLPSAQDIDLWLRLARASHRFVAVPEPLVVKHEHGAGQITGDPFATLAGFREMERRWGPLVRERLGDEAYRRWIGRRLSRIGKVHARYLRATASSGKLADGARYALRMLRFLPWAAFLAARLLGLALRSSRGRCGPSRPPPRSRRQGE